MQRVPGSRYSRGFRGRGRRGYYQARGHYVNSPPYRPLSVPASTNYVAPVDRLSNQIPGVVPTEGTTVVKIESHASPALKNTLYGQSSAHAMSPANYGGGNPVVPLLTEQSTLATSTQSMSTGGIHSPTNSEQLQQNQQQYQEPHVEHSTTENLQDESLKITGSESGSVSVGATNNEQGNRDRSSSPTDLYLYGPHSDLSAEPESVLGKRKEPPNAGGDDEGEEREGEESDLEDKDGTKKAKTIDSSSLLTPEVIMEINKKVIGIVKNADFDIYVCILCLAQINSRKNLEKHIGANEHMRRVGCLLSPPGDNVYHFCETCCVTCLNEEVYSNHIKGKKHAKNVQLSSKIKSMVIVAVGDSLEDLLKREVVKSGDGLHLGLSPTMMKFFTMEGPFIGLQYAEEVGVENDPNPSYHCTLCGISMDGGNQSLHFTSTTHRMNVLKKDYPDKHSIAKETSDSAEKKSELSNKLREICAEIESKDGRKVELINRVIISTRFNKGPAKGSNYNAASYTPYGGHSVSGGTSSGYRGRYPSPSRGNSSWQPQQKGRGRERGFTSSPSFGYSSSGEQHQGRGGTASRRGGGVDMWQRGRGRGSQTFSSNHSDSYSGYSNFGGTEPQHTYSDSTASMGRGHGQYGGATGPGQATFTTGYSQGGGRGHQPTQPWSSSPGPSHGHHPPVPPLQLNTDPPHLPFQHPPGQSPSPLFGGPPIAPPTAPPITPPIPGSQRVPHSPMQRFPSHMVNQSSPTSPWAPPTWLPQPPPPQPPQQAQYGYGHERQQFGEPHQQRQPHYGHQQQHFGGGGEDHSVAGLSVAPPQGSASDTIKALEGTVIESEEDAERALRLSSALTQKLLAYRFKTVSSNNPIMTLLNTLQASGLQPQGPSPGP